MNILLVSQCQKNALTETRRILDQFAERCGDRVWQTPITQAGLDTLHKMLRQTARKNTAVACYWTHGKNLTDLIRKGVCRRIAPNAIFYVPKMKTVGYRRIPSKL